MGKTNPKNLADEVGKRQPFASPRQEAYLNLVRTHTLLAGQLSRLFKQHGLTDPKYNALRILRGEGKPMQVYHIAERMVTPQTDVTRLVDRLEEAGLVERERCGEDRRVVWVTLTEQGKDVLKKLDKPVADLHESQFAGLSKTELKQLNDLLFRSRQS
ncbi:MAG: MarR family transcriptional regulator [Planctomycetota bacterium]|nr:MAG: MarR family transcriptional regulator [Planctomycetota bacterium]